MAAMKTNRLGLSLAVVLLGAGCGRSELDFEAEDNEGQVSSSSLAGSAGLTTAWAPGENQGGTIAAGGQAAGSQGGQSPVAGATFIQPPASAGAGVLASRSSSQGGIRGGTTALPPPDGTRPPVAGRTGGIRGGTTFTMGGRVAGFTATAGRSGTMGGTITITSRGGSSGGSSASTGRGGSSAVGGSGGYSSSSCPGLAASEDLIDDMNDGNRTIPTTNGRAGAWNVSHDVSPDGTMFPATSSAFTMTETGDSCRKKAVYSYGSLFVDWGCNVWVSLGSPYDASKDWGISFWAKVDPGANTSLRVAFPDKDTQPAGGLCDASVSSGPTSCFDHYGKRLINLTTEWKKYTVSFSELNQERWGRQGTAFDPTSVYEILFQISKIDKFGLWIDDLSFLRLPDLY